MSSEFDMLLLGSRGFVRFSGVGYVLAKVALLHQDQESKDVGLSSKTF